MSTLFFSWAAKPCNTTGSFSSLILLLTDTVIQYCRCVPASGICRSSPLIVVFSLVLSHFGHVPCPSGASTLPNIGKHIAPPGHIFFSCRAQNLPFYMTVRIKCPSAFGDRHRSKIESGYHSVYRSVCLRVGDAQSPPSAGVRFPCRELSLVSGSRAASDKP